MAASFSGALRLTDLDDFITPSQECVKPIVIEKKKNKINTIRIEDDGGYVEVDEAGTEYKLKKAQITLQDCLACSGCVTSAETVLITQQSQDELYKVLAQNKICTTTERKLVVVSVSPQTVASLAAKYKLTLQNAAQRLNGFFVGLGVDYVLDVAYARHFSLIESGREFVDRFQRQQAGETDLLPMVTSACPGWICYAEKTHGSYILPFISTTRSPQQVMGSLLKHHLVTRHCDHVTPDRVYHVTVMPCFDKKLEASRSDFYSDVYSTRDVDCVITTGEVDLMLEKEGVSLCDVTAPATPTQLGPLPGLGQTVFSHGGGGSGGYLDYVIKHASRELFNMEQPEITSRTLRNKDFREVTVCQDGHPLLKFAFAYGFRNIQNIVQKLKRGKSTYHFVEVMACPAGCLNGGGQLRPGLPEQASALLEEVQTLYQTADTVSPRDDVTVQQIYDQLGAEEGGDVRTLLHTQYHQVEKMTTALTVKW